MKDSLKTLERVKKFEIDEHRRILMQKLEREESLQNLLIFETFQYENYCF